MSVVPAIPDEKVITLIRTHVQRYNAIDIMDVYKLLHQATFGPGQVIKNQRAAREWLDRESETLATVSIPEALVENIHPEGQIVRLHLRPYLAVRGDLRKLLDGFIQSSRSVEGNPAALASWWMLFQHMSDPGELFANRFDHRTVSLIGRTRANEQWPASHHSPPYDRTYKPVYRVLTRAIAETVLQDQKINFIVS